MQPGEAAAAAGTIWKATDYGDAGYWDARYKTEKGGAPFDWYRSYAALRPFLRHFVPTSCRVLMLGCGNSLMSEHMAMDGYTEIVNVDISSVVIDMMKQRHGHIPQLTYMEMDVRDMSLFSDTSFESVVDKGTLDALMCGTDASQAASQMLGEVNRVLKQGGIYMLITYGAPSARVQYLKQAGLNWKLTLYILSSSRVEEETNGSSSSAELSMEPVPLTENGQLPPGFVLGDLESHYIYVCEKLN
ncbi:S-adenosyl-L-methionine-dependent methyltransferases superfamily protein [Rhynchospora pubera]|uniref:S-adenosyl-L-methionine-dependent methyltransferases superfamily protein n=1 Tax=Rhynchospora pubera TaxID=906938 RepID=A0AAV8ELQ6_9POAL|nr:S-adenosyl-L-methionine-dependent methyltransferases superfamily protein [Rhynchospora pubera]KAJ4786333.1 S-adenosyl-L-methionine-dependent methyltransferases superfamily protein [Rhynchospora pubera]